MPMISAKAASARLLNIHLSLMTEDMKRTLLMLRRNADVDPVETAMLTDMAQSRLPGMVKVLSVLMSTTIDLNDFFIICDPYAMSALDIQLRASREYLEKLPINVLVKTADTDAEFFSRYALIAIDKS